MLEKINNDSFSKTEEENPLNKLINENNEFLNLWREEIFKESKNEIINLDEDLTGINFINELFSKNKNNSEIFLTIAKNSLDYKIA